MRTTQPPLQQTTTLRALVVRLLVNGKVVRPQKSPLLVYPHPKGVDYASAKNLRVCEVGGSSLEFQSGGDLSR